MTKLNQEELLSILTAVFSYYLSKCNFKETATKYEEAHQQIREMIQKPGVTEDWIGKMVEESVYILHQDKYAFFERKFKEVGVEVTKK